MDLPFDLGLFAEVQEQTYLHIGGFEIVDQLALVFFAGTLRRFEINDDQSLDDQVGIVATDLHAYRTR